MTAILVFFGIILILTPAIMTLNDGVRSDEDYIQWMMNRPIEDILLFQFGVKSGLLFVGIGAASYYLP